MKFETPIMNISMFEMENVATTASSTNFDTAIDQAEGKAAAAANAVAITVAF